MCMLPDNADATSLVFCTGALRTSVRLLRSYDPFSMYVSGSPTDLLSMELMPCVNHEPSLSCWFDLFVDLVLSYLYVFA